MLQAVPGEGYRIVPSVEQTREAQRARLRNIAKEIQKLDREVINVNLIALDDKARRENADALARVGMLKQMFSKVRRVTRTRHQVEAAESNQAS